MSGAGSGGGDEFGRAVAKIAVTQLCEALGFHAFQSSSAETLADIAIRFLSDLGKTANFYANLAGRTQCNALDVIAAMENVGTGPASYTETSRPLSSSGALKEVMRYVEYSEEIPFARPLPHFPVSKMRASPPSFALLGETPPFPHIPFWLPAFPDPHTYKATPVWTETKRVPSHDKLEQAKQRRKAERSLISLHLRLSSSGTSTKYPEAINKSTDPSPSGAVGFPLASKAGRPIPGIASGWVPANPSVFSREQWPSGEPDAACAKLELDGNQGKGKGKRVATVQNPFLAPPYAAGEKEASTIVFTREAENNVMSMKVEGNMALPSVLDVFAVALDAANQGFDNTEAIAESSGSGLPEYKDRRPVLLCFDWGRKTRAKALAAQMSLGGRYFSPIEEKGKGIVHGKEEEKDDKKKRAEQILSQAMEGAYDMSQTC